MSFFIWKDSFNTHISVLDRQHQKLFAVLNQLFDAAHHPVDNNFVMQLLREMNEYANVHFTTEERLMTHYEYPGLEAQKIQHEYYREQLVQLTRSFDEDNEAVCKQSLQFLRNWFLGHILLEDLKFHEAFAHKMHQEEGR
jgi:hemerythrin-like metal-binding protein